MHTGVSFLQKLGATPGRNPTSPRISHPDTLVYIHPGYPVPGYDVLSNFIASGLIVSFREPTRVPGYPGTLRQPAHSSKKCIWLDGALVPCKITIASSCALQLRCVPG
eukprot:661373-Rhodomonas_salina.1